MSLDSQTASLAPASSWRRIGTESRGIADRYRIVAAPLIERVTEGCRVQNRAHERLWRDTVTALAEPRRGPGSTGASAGHADDVCRRHRRHRQRQLRRRARVDHRRRCEVSLFEPDRKVNLIDKVGPWEVCSRRVELALALRAAQQNKLTDEVVAALAGGGQPHRATYPASAYLCEALQPYFADHTATRYNESSSRASGPGTRSGASIRRASPRGHRRLSGVATEPRRARPAAQRDEP